MTTRTPSPSTPTPTMTAVVELGSWNSNTFAVPVDRLSTFLTMLAEFPVVTSERIEIGDGDHAYRYCLNDKASTPSVILVNYPIVAKPLPKEEPAAQTED